MARIALEQSNRFPVRDRFGPVRAGVEVYVYTDETLDTEATIYAASTGGSTIDQPLQTDVSGRLDGYVEEGPCWIHVPADEQFPTGRWDAGSLINTASDLEITGRWKHVGDVEVPLSLVAADDLPQLRLTDIADPAHQAGAIYWYADEGLDTDGLGWVTAIDVAAPVPYRDLVLAGKTGYPGPGNVKDFIYVCHNGATDQPTVGIGAGISPVVIGTEFALVVKPDDTDEPAVGNLRLVRGDSQTGDVFAVTTTGGPTSKQVWIDKDYALTVKSSATTSFHVKNNGDTTMLKVRPGGSGAVVAPVPVGMGAGAPDAPTAQLDIVETSTTDAVVKVRTASNGSFEIRSEGDTAAVRLRTLNASTLEFGTNSGKAIEIGTAGQLGFYGAAPVAKQTGVAVTAAGIHAALVNLGLIAA